MAETATLYDLLLSAPDAPAEEIKRAYLRLIRTYHPDVAGPHGEAMTQRLNGAWDVLKDPASRSAYDRSLRQPVAEPVAEPATEPAYQPPTEPAEWGTADAGWEEADVVDEPAYAATAGHPAKPRRRRPWTRGRITTTMVASLLLMGALGMLWLGWTDPTGSAGQWRLLLLPTAAAALITVFWPRRLSWKWLVVIAVPTAVLPAGLGNVWPFGFALDALGFWTALAASAAAPLAVWTRFARGARW